MFIKKRKAKQRNPDIPFCRFVRWQNYSIAGWVLALLSKQPSADKAVDGCVIWGLLKKQGDGG